MKVSNNIKNKIARLNNKLLINYINKLVIKKSNNGEDYLVIGYSNKTNTFVKTFKDLTHITFKGIRFNDNTEVVLDDTLSGVDKDFLGLLLEVNKAGGIEAYVETHEFSL